MSRRISCESGRLLLILAVTMLTSHVAPSGTGSLSVRVEPGWNLLSLPVKLSNARRDSLFPTAMSSAYVYPGMYQAKDTLEHGEGFWLKFASTDTFIVEGDMNLGDTIEVQKGWNIVGSLSLTTVVDSIRTNPSFMYAAPMGNGRTSPWCRVPPASSSRFSPCRTT